MEGVVLGPVEVVRSGVEDGAAQKELGSGTYHLETTEKKA